MAGPKAKTPAPIDRPLSKAYLRQFLGWSTAEPPGISDPTSLRKMENIIINRDGSAGIRPGLRYLSYEQAPFTTPEDSVVLPFSVFHEGWGTDGSYGTYTLSGLQTGDLVVCAMKSGDETIFDPRFSIVANLGQTAGILGPYDARVWAATIGSDTSNVTFPHTGTVLRLRNPDGIPLELDPLRVSLPDGTHYGNSGSIAALPGGGSGAISCILTGGSIGGGYGTTHWDPPFVYLDDASNGAYGLTYISHTTAEFVGSIPAPQRDAKDVWRGCSLGIKYGSVIL